MPAQMIDQRRCEGRFARLRQADDAEAHLPPAHAAEPIGEVKKGRGHLAASLG
jgi:hypothetical protein